MKRHIIPSLTMLLSVAMAQAQLTTHDWVVSESPHDKINAVEKQTRIKRICFIGPSV